MNADGTFHPVTTLEDLGTDNGITIHYPVVLPRNEIQDQTRENSLIRLQAYDRLPEANGMS